MILLVAIVLRVARVLHVVVLAVADVIQPVLARQNLHLALDAHQVVRVVVIQDAPALVEQDAVESVRMHVQVIVNLAVSRVVPKLVQEDVEVDVILLAPELA